MTSPIERRIEAKLDRFVDLAFSRVIGVREASEILGVSTREIQRRAKEGRLRCITNSRPYRFFLSDVVGKY